MTPADQTSGPPDEGPGPVLYDRLAPWWPLLSPPEEYAEEAAFYAEVMTREAGVPVREVLELGSGGGNNASHLKARFRLTLVDPSERMLAVSRALNPECRHVRGDMRTVRLGERFDAVFVHDAVCYMTTSSDLGRAMETAYRHLRPGGVALFAPDHVREGFVETTDRGGRDVGRRGLRYLEWSWDPDPEDDTYRVDYALLLRSEGGTVECVHDSHLEGLFSRERWLTSLREAGFEAPTRVPSAHAGLGWEVDVFTGRRPR